MVNDSTHRWNHPAVWFSVAVSVLHLFLRSIDMEGTWKVSVGLAALGFILPSTLLWFSEFLSKQKAHIATNVEKAAYWAFPCLYGFYLLLKALRGDPPIWGPIADGVTVAVLSVFLIILAATLSPSSDIIGRRLHSISTRLAFLATAISKNNRLGLVLVGVSFFPPLMTADITVYALRAIATGDLVWSNEWSLFLSLQALSLVAGGMAWGFSKGLSRSMNRNPFWIWSVLLLLIAFRLLRFSFPGLGISSFVSYGNIGLVVLTIVWLVVHSRALNRLLLHPFGLISRQLLDKIPSFGDKIQNKQTKRLVLSLGWLASVLSVAGLAYLAFVHPLGPDAGYYVLSAEAFFEGRSSLAELTAIYPPGSFLLQGLYQKIHDGAAEGLRIQILLHHVLITIFISLTLLRLKVIPKHLGWLPFVLYIIGSWFLEGLYLIIEPFSSLYGWAGIYLATRGMTQGHPERATRAFLPGRADWLPYLFAGFLGAVAANVKQVGLVFPVLLLAMSWIGTSKNRRSRVVSCLTGVFLCELFVVSINPADMFILLKSNIYRLLVYASTDPSTNQMRTHLEIVAFLRRAWVSVPILLSALTAIGALYSERRKSTVNDPAQYNRGLTFLAFSIIAGSTLLPSLIRPYGHYYLFPLPFAVSGAIYTFSVIWKSRSIYLRYALIAIFFLLLSGLPSTGKSLLRDQVIHWRKEQAVADWIRSNSDALNEAVIVVGVPQYYLLTGLRPPLDLYGWLGCKTISWRTSAKARAKR